MAQDRSHFLDDLPIWKLKLVAVEYKLDVSSCRYKKDYVQKLKGKKITEEQVRVILAKNQRSAKEEEAIRKEVEEIASKPGEPAGLPDEDEKNLERHIDEALTLKPAFFEIDSATENAYDKMILGDYYDAIKVNRDGRLRCLDIFSNSQVYYAAIAIRAVDELLSKMAQENVQIDPGLRTALTAAKLTFIKGPPRAREEALENLESLAMKTYDAFVSGSEKKEAELRELLTDYESFGTRTEEPRRYLEIASQAKQSHSIGEYSKLVAQAGESAASARDTRVKEIENAFHIVKAGADEARDLGIDISSMESTLGQARSAFDDGAFRQAVELLAATERSIDQAHVEELKRRKELEALQLQKVNTIVIDYGPLIREAKSYGIDVREPLVHIGNVKSALDSKDVVSATKYARRVKDLMQVMENEIDQKRLELGVIKHVEGTKCGKCSQESLYAYPNGIQKCLECGHAFTIEPAIEQEAVAQAARRQAEESDQAGSAQTKAKPEKKKKSLFRW
jgi:ribosomal protein L37AE/L43A